MGSQRVGHDLVTEQQQYVYAVTEQSLGLLAWCTAKPADWCQVVVKESTAFIWRALGKENGQLMLKRSESLMVLRIFKGNIRREGCRVHDHGHSSDWLVMRYRGGISGTSAISFLTPTCLESAYWWSSCSQLSPPGQGLVSSKKPKYIHQEIIHCPWGVTKHSWLCVMAKVFLLCLALILSFVSTFSHFSD